MKGQEAIILTSFLIVIVFVVILQSVGVNVPLIGSLLEHEVTVRKDVYTMDNALDAAENYFGNAVRYSTYQTCHDSLRKPSNLINELLFVEDAENQMRENLRKYTLEDYRFLGNNRVDFPEFSVEVRPITGSGFVTAEKPAFIEKANEEEKETVRLERPMRASFQLPCYSLYISAAAQYTGVYNNVYAVLSAETLKLPPSESSGEAVDCNALFESMARLSIADAEKRAADSIAGKLGEIKPVFTQANIETSFKAVSTGAKITFTESRETDRATNKVSLHCKFNYEIFAVISGTVRDMEKAYPVFSSGDVQFKPLEASFVQKVSTGTSPSTAPTPFDQLIAQASALFGTEEAMVKAIISKESSFDPNAVSPGNAKGLMQLLPIAIRDVTTDGKPSHEYCEPKFAFTPDYIDYNTATVFDPEKNINVGTCYFSYLLDRYRNDNELALAAYNAGPTKVDELRRCTGNAQASWDDILSSGSVVKGNSNLPNCEVAKETVEYPEKVLDYYRQFAFITIAQV